MPKSPIIRQLKEILNNKVPSSSLLRLQKTASHLDSRFADHSHTQLAAPLIHLCFWNCEWTSKLFIPFQENNNKQNMLPTQTIYIFDVHNYPLNNWYALCGCSINGSERDPNCHGHGYFQAYIKQMPPFEIQKQEDLVPVTFHAPLSSDLRSEKWTMSTPMMNVAFSETPVGCIVHTWSTGTADVISKWTSCSHPYPVVTRKNTWRSLSQQKPSVVASFSESLLSNFILHKRSCVYSTVITHKAANFDDQVRRPHTQKYTV